MVSGSLEATAFQEVCLGEPGNAYTFRNLYSHLPVNATYEKRVNMHRNPVWKLVPSLVLIIPLAGCYVSSLQPFYRADDLIFEKALIGEWRNDDGKSRLTFTQAGEDSYLIFNSDEDGLNGYEGHLLEIDGRRYLDVFAWKPARKRAFEDLHAIPVHSLWQVKLDGDKLWLVPMQKDRVKELIEKPGSLIPIQPVNDELVLTAPTEELQEWVRLNQKKIFALREGDTDAPVPWQRATELKR